MIGRTRLYKWCNRLYPLCVSRAMLAPTVTFLFLLQLFLVLSGTVTFFVFIIAFLVLSGKFPYAHESGHSFIKAFTAVRIIKFGRQFVQPQADFRRNSIVTIYFSCDVLIFVTIRFLTDF